MKQDLIPLRLELTGMANQLFDLVGVRPAQATEKQRQQLAAYAFGMAFVLGQEHQLEPAEVHALVITYLLDVLGYSQPQAVRFAEMLIQATANPSPHPKLSALAHRGIDGYPLLKTGANEPLRADLLDVLGLPPPKPKAAKAETKSVAARAQVYQEFFGTPQRIDEDTELPRIDVHIYAPPDEERNWYTLVTSGMSDTPMNVPDGGSGATRAELILYVWEPTDHLVKRLRWLARTTQGRWVHFGTTMNNGNPPQPIFPDSKLTCFLFLPTYVEPDATLEQRLSIGGEGVKFLWVVPTTSKECVFIVHDGPEAFIELMTQAENCIVLDEQRHSYLRFRK
jgi:hypothetical protein